MSDDKMTEDCAGGTTAGLSQLEDTVVQALDAAVWSDSEAEAKIRAKLQEFATELQTIKTILDF